MPWRGIGIGSGFLALGLVFIELAANVLAALSIPGVVLAGLHARLMLPALCLTAVLVAVATLAAIRRLRLKPDRVRFRVRDLMCFALACTTLVLLPSEALLAHWASQPDIGVGHAWPLIHTVQLLSLLVTAALLLRGLRESWYAD